MWIGQSQNKYVPCWVFNVHDDDEFELLKDTILKVNYEIN